MGISGQEVLDWLEIKGPEEVALLVETGSIAPRHKAVALGWLTEKRREEARYQENLETMRLKQQLDLAESANKAAWIAACAAVIGIVVGIIGIAVTLFR